MNKLAAIAILVILGCAATVAAVTPCDSPTVWEGRQIEVDPTKDEARVSDLFYDASEQRVATIDEVFVNDKNKTFYHTILLFSTKTAYLIDLNTKKCEVQTIDFPFRQFGVPPNATFFGEFTIGSDAVPGAGVTVQRWGLHNKDKYWDGHVTAVGCVPVSDNFRDPRVGVVHTDFFDISLGISRPDVFVPPPECSQ